MEQRGMWAGRCPWCLESGFSVGVACGGCGRAVEPPPHDKRQSWAGIDERWLVAYPPSGSLERRWGTSVHAGDVRGRADDELDDAVLRRSEARPAVQTFDRAAALFRPYALRLLAAAPKQAASKKPARSPRREELLELLGVDIAATRPEGDGHGAGDGAAFALWMLAAELGVIQFLALWLWDHDPMFGGNWYRKDPRRPRFARVDSALAFQAPALGVGSLFRDVATPKLRIKHPGLRPGIMHVQPSHVGTSRARGAEGVELQADVDMAVRRSGVTAEDLWLHREAASHEDERGRTDWVSLARQWLFWRRLAEGRGGPRREIAEEELSDPANDERLAQAEQELDASAAREAEAVRRRVTAARRRIARTMRLAPLHPISAYDGIAHDPDEAPLLKPASKREQARREQTEAVVGESFFPEWA